MSETHLLASAPTLEELYTRLDRDPEDCDLVAKIPSSGIFDD